MRRGIVVGLERSEPGRAAVEYAADLANRRQLPLRLVHAFEPSLAADRAPIGRNDEVSAVLRSAAQRVVDDARDVYGILYPDLEISATVETGSATNVLIDASKGADTLVLGSRGTGRFADLVVGTTTVRVTAHAACPVIAVPGRPYGEAPRHGVVVGVDGSGLSEAAIGYAFEAASEVGERLTAVHASYDPAHMGVGVMMPIGYDPALAAHDERLVLAESMAGWQEKFPDVAVEHLVVLGQPVPTLVSRSTHARLLVVGSHGHGALRSLVLGSVSHGVLHHATGPVAVVRS
jgi:nucleotide-binding universal stress UspA family protein